MPQTAPTITITHCSVRMGQGYALRNASWTLAPGEHWTLLGGNGAGKTTLMRLARGEIHPAQGQPFGHAASRSWDFGDGPTASALDARARIALVSADDQDAWVRYDRPYTGEELVCTGILDTLALWGEPGPEVRRRARAQLRSLDAEEFADRNVLELSRGQARLVHIARSLARAPRVLLLDEALEGLDSGMRTRILDALAAQAARGTQIVLTTHHLNECPAFLTHAAVMADGAIRESGPARDILDAADAQATARAARPAAQPPETFDHSVKRSAQCGVDHAQKAPGGTHSADIPESCENASRTGGADHRTRPGTDHTPHMSPSQGHATKSPSGQDQGAPRAAAGIDAPCSPILELADVTVVRGGRTALRDVNWTVRPSEHWAVLGHNGAGKSTLAALATAALRPSSGHIAWFGQSDAVNVWDLRRRIGLVSPELQAGYRYNVTALELTASGFYSSVGLYDHVTPIQAERARRCMALTGMTGFEERPIRSLSYGQIRRLIIARALVTRPDLLILDEPSAGLDAAARTGFLADLDALGASGATLVVITHRPEEIPACVQNAMVIEQGRITAMGPRGEVLS